MARTRIRITKLALALMLAMAASPFAQEQGGQEEFKGTKLGVRAGFHLMSMGPLDLSAGWHFGAVRDVAELTSFEIFGNQIGIYFQPGLFFLTKSSIWDKNTYWLEVPAMVSFRRQPASSRAYRFEIGPYFDFGLFGDFKGDIETLLGENYKNDMSRFDVGLQLTVAHEYKMFWAASSISQGFLDVDDYNGGTSFCWKLLTIGINF